MRGFRSTTYAVSATVAGSGWSRYIGFGFAKDRHHTVPHDLTALVAVPIWIPYDIRVKADSRVIGGCASPEQACDVSHEVNAARRIAHFVVVPRRDMD